MKFILAPLTALIVSLFFTPLAGRLAFKLGALDKPDQRKVHRGLMPRMGGPVIFLSFALAALWSVPLKSGFSGILAGAFLIMLLGLYDDIYGLNPRIKLAGQVVVSFLAAYFWGIKVILVSNPFGSGTLELGIWAVPLTVVWLVAVINSVNLIDGLDGLAGGTSLIAALTMAVVVWLEWRRPDPVDMQVALLALVLAGSTLGFLRYNFYPARIFLGDSGSMLLGFLLASMAVMGLTKGAATLSVIIPLVILGIPLMDTVFAIVRRYNKRAPIFQPDRGHLHHRLLDLGLKHRQAVMVIYGVDLVLGASAVLLTYISATPAFILLILIAFLAIVAANKLGIISDRLPVNYRVKETGGSSRDAGS